MSSAANKVFAVPELLEHVLLDISTNEIYQNGMVKQLLLSWSCDLDNTDTTVSAARKVFADRKLLDRILKPEVNPVRTDTCSLKQLCSTRRVNRTFCQLLDTSQKLRRAMCLAPEQCGSIRSSMLKNAQNPLLFGSTFKVDGFHVSVKPYVDVNARPVEQLQFDCSVTSWVNTGLADKSLCPNTKASWREMLLLRGPLTVHNFEVLMEARVLSRQCYELENNGTATLGDLVDYVIGCHLDPEVAEDNSEDSDEDYDYGFDDLPDLADMAPPEFDWDATDEGGEEDEEGEEGE